MTNYTVSYYVKNVTKFEEGATVTDMGNGWFRVVKVMTAPFVFPIGSAGHTIYAPSAIADEPPKAKRKAAWKQNPLNRYLARG